MLEYVGVPELHNGTPKITDPELSFRMNRVSILALFMDEGMVRENGTAMEPETIAGFTRRCSVS